MTTRRALLTGLAGCAASALCPAPLARSGFVPPMSDAQMMIPLTEIWYFSSPAGAVRVVWSDQGDPLSRELAPELPFGTFSSPNDAVLS